MTALIDSFTDTAAVLLKNHIADSGHTWLSHPNATRDFLISNANRLMMSALSGTNWCYSSYIPPTADYQMALDLVCVTEVDTFPGFILRCDPAADTGIFIRWNGTSNLWIIQQRVTGTATTLGSAAGVLTAGQTKRLKGSVVGAAVTLYVDDVVVATGTTTITDKGRLAVRQITNAVVDNTHGIHMDNLNGPQEGSFAGAGGSGLVVLFG